MNDKGNVTSRIIAYIKNNIRKGTWQIGEKLPSENELCKLLNVSRVSVRSALQQFIALGILESIHGKGTFLVSNDLSVFGDADDNANGEDQMRMTESIADMKYLLEFRSMVEPETCSIVTNKATPELIARLTDDLEKMKASVGDSAAFIQADMDFHYALSAATGNPVTTEIMADVLKNKKESYRSLNHAVGYYGGIYYHTLLLDAIKRRDTKQAHNLMLEHLKHSIGDLDLEEENGSDGFKGTDGM